MLTMIIIMMSIRGIMKFWSFMYDNNIIRDDKDVDDNNNITIIIIIITNFSWLKRWR